MPLFYSTFSMVITLRKTSRLLPDPVWTYHTFVIQAFYKSYYYHHQQLIVVANSISTTLVKQSSKTLQCLTKYLRQICKKDWNSTFCGKIKGKISFNLPVLLQNFYFLIADAPEILFKVLNPNISSLKLLCNLWDKLVHSIG